MKVNNGIPGDAIKSKSPASAAPVRRVSAPVAGSVTRPEAPAADRVRVSSAASELSRASAAMAQTESQPADEARIAALRAAIREGRYPIDVAALARSIVEKEGLTS